jgi:fumarylacetoacetase
MRPAVDETHDPGRRSWVATANEPGTDFPLQNLPYGVFRTPDAERPRIGVAIGDHVLDLGAAADRGPLEASPATLAACREPDLNGLMALAAPERLALRRSIARLLEEHHPAGRDPALRSQLLRSQAETSLLLPARIGDYTDFYASIHHATRVGELFRPDQPLLPNYKWVPIGYHGRASSIVPSGQPVRRPSGQTRAADADGPRFGPSRQLDYELEVGAWIAGGNPLGAPVPLDQAGERLFGVSLLNDWSARDLQAWEYQPLGPFLAKDFATTVSPWVVTMEALAPFRVPAIERPAGDPAPLPYLDSACDRSHGGLALTLAVALCSARMREQGLPPFRVSRARFEQMYWTLAQLVTHQTSNGCNLRPGDLLGSGTVSGPGADERGCLLEITRRGREPLTLPTGETRFFLEDGDEVVMTGWCERPGAARIGLGECRGVIVGAREFASPQQTSEAETRRGPQS